MNYTIYSKKPEERETTSESKPIKKIDGQAIEPSKAKGFKMVTVVNCSQLNLRAGVSTESKILHILNKDDNLILIHEEGEWAYVRTTLLTPELEGFVMNKFIE